MREREKAGGQAVVTFLTTVLLLAALMAAGKEKSVKLQETDARQAGSSQADTSFAAAAERETKTYKGIVVLDAGHGGADPGKIGIDGTLEKDVNLRIALLVKRDLEAQDVQVILTRENGDGLYDADASNKKVQDMKRRIDIIEAASPTLAVSIHQNSYPEEYVRGAQVFYYTDSAQGRKLAQFLQDSLVRRLDPGNHRQIKANNSYYMLKKASVPIVIVECGFLSNMEEAAKLNDSEYQEQVAWAIHMGILQYLNAGD